MNLQADDVAQGTAASSCVRCRCDGVPSLRYPGLFVEGYDGASRVLRRCRMLCLPFFREVGIWSFLADEACLLKSPLGIGQLHKAGACTEARAFLMGPMLGKGDELESVEFGVLATSSNPAPVPAIPDAGTYITSSPSTIKGLYISTTCHELSCTALLNIDNLLHEAPISEFFF